MNFLELSARIIEQCANDEADFAAAVPGFVNHVENELLRRIDSFWIDSEVSLTCSVSASRLATPSTMKLIKHIRLVEAGRSRNIVMQDEAWVREYWPQETSVGETKYYARTSGDEILLAPAPTSTVAVYIKGLMPPDVLSSTNVSNVILNRAETALFYGSMQQANLWMKAWKTAAEWERLYNSEVELFINESRRGRRDSTRPQNAQGNSGNNVIPGVP